MPISLLQPWIPSSYPCMLPFLIAPQLSWLEIYWLYCLMLVPSFCFPQSAARREPSAAESGRGCAGAPRAPLCGRPALASSPAGGGTRPQHPALSQPLGRFQRMARSGRLRAWGARSRQSPSGTGAQELAPALLAPNGGRVKRKKIPPWKKTRAGTFARCAVTANGARRNESAP